MKFIRGSILLIATLPFALAADFDWHGRLNSGQTIEIKGVNGTVRAERASGGEVEVSAIKIGRRSDPRAVQITAVNHPGGITLCAVYPSDDFGRGNDCRPGSGGHMSVHNNDVRVEFTVRVPPGVNFVGRTVNGEVEAASLSGDVEAYTVNGRVRISTTGFARANTVNGSITASLGKGNWTHPLAFQTVNGSIRLDLPPAAGAQLRAATVNGHISTDFPLALRGRFNGKHISGTLGAGGPELSLKTVNGSIDIRRNMI